MARGKFLPGQAVRSFAAKQGKRWRIGERHFLGLAQGVGMPGQEERNRPSMVYEWDGSAFAEFQQIPSRWAYNWCPDSLSAEVTFSSALMSTGCCLISPERS
jgi:hypothetical protein